MLCALLIGFIQICFAEVGSRFVDSGGPYLIARTALGPSVGFVVGWLYWIVRVLTFATISNLLVAYVARFVPGAAAGAWRATTITLVVGGITLLHLFGIRHATIVSNALTILKIGFLAAFGVLGALSATGSLPERGAPPPIGALGNAILLGTFAFAGFEASMVAAGETRDPRRNTPFAIATSLLTALVLYLGVQVVCMMSVPALATSAAPVADAAVVLWGPFGEQLVAGSAIIMMLGTLNGGFLATSRLPFSFAEQGDLPAVLGRVHARFRTPHVAILGSAAIVLIATLTSSFLSAIKLAASTRILAYIAGCVALIVLRRRTDVSPAGFVAPYGRAFAVIAVALSVALLTSASGRELIQLGLAASSGIVVYALFGSAARRARRREALKLSEER